MCVPVHTHKPYIYTHTHLSSVSCCMSFPKLIVRRFITSQKTDLLTQEELHTRGNSAGNGNFIYNCLLKAIF